MTTIVNNPTPAPQTGNSMGPIIGLVMIIVLAYLFIVYGLPAISRLQVGTPQINVPNQIDVNVKQTK